MLSLKQCLTWIALGLGGGFVQNHILTLAGVSASADQRLILSILPVIFMVAGAVAGHDLWED